MLRFPRREAPCGRTGWVAALGVVGAVSRVVDSLAVGDEGAEDVVRVTVHTKGGDSSLRPAAARRQALAE